MVSASQFSSCPGLGVRESNESVGMRDRAFREYAETTSRELVGAGIRRASGVERVVRDRIKLLRSAKPRRNSPPIENDRHGHDLALDEAASLEEMRTPFARELGDTWVEVEPGIFKHVPSAPAESLLPTTTR